MISVLQIEVLSKFLQEELSCVLKVRQPLSYYNAVGLSLRRETSSIPRAASTF